MTISCFEWNRTDLYQNILIQIGHIVNFSRWTLYKNLSRDCITHLSSIGIEITFYICINFGASFQFNKLLKIPGRWWTGSRDFPSWVEVSSRQSLEKQCLYRVPWCSRIQISVPSTPMCHLMPNSSLLASTLPQQVGLIINTFAPLIEVILENI